MNACDMLLYTPLLIIVMSFNVNKSYENVEVIFVMMCVVLWIVML